jgi:hypothetical protein
MQRLIGIVAVLALLVAVSPAIAGDAFHALSQLPTTERAALTPLPDKQLASVEGAQVEGICLACLAVPTLVNLTTQLNAAKVDQSNSNRTNQITRQGTN